MKTLARQLEEFAKRSRFRGKGPLSVALIVTKRAIDQGLPLDPKTLLSKGGGQVAGLGRAPVQAILRKHGSERVLSEEGGRTSRGSIRNMEKYAMFLNGLNRKGPVDLIEIEKWWIGQVRAFFAGKPFTLKHDPAKSLMAVVRDLLSQAKKRQADRRGMTIVGTVLEHLVGAKLDIILHPDEVKHHGSSEADASSASRDADFRIKDVAIHVTTAPGESVVRKCRRNLETGHRPIIVTTDKGTLVAQTLAEQAGIGGRIDVFGAEQFLAGNIYELGRFSASGRRTTIIQLIEKYNEIVESCERNPALRIEVGK